MGVYIRSMQIPKCCGDCYVGFVKQIGCELNIGFNDYATARHPDCPLCEITTPHGRLVDLDALIGEIEDKNSVAYEDGWGRGRYLSSYCELLDNVVEEIEDALTIIEAEAEK